MFLGTPSSFLASLVHSGRHYTMFTNFKVIRNRIILSKFKFQKKGRTVIKSQLKWRG